MHGITRRKSVWDCADWTGDAFVAIAGKLLSDCITYGKNKGCFKPAPEMQASLSSSFPRLYPFDEIQEEKALQTQPLSPSAGVLSLFQVFDSTLMLI